MATSDLELRVAWQRYVAAGPAGEAALEALLRRHSGPGRHYHDVRHVRWVVRHVLELTERFDDTVEDPGAVVAAAFFHDAVYGGTDDERQSADLAVRTLSDLGWARGRCDLVAELVLATDHRSPPSSRDAAVLVAADLAVLAAAPAVYGDYVRSVRKEYGRLDDTTWRTGRAEVLRGFLDRPAIFPADLGLDAWERRARANLTAELAALR